MIANESKVPGRAGVSTKYRRIVTEIPVPESLPVLTKLHAHEPRSMGGQPPVIWDRAEGFQVYDRWGNMWLDWSCGVLVTNAGHCHPTIRKAILEQVEHGLIHNYCFPSEVRAKTVAALAEVAPEALGKVFLLTTGAEACECAIKLARSWGRHAGGDRKIGIVTFQNAFHGRTLGAQMAGGIPSLKQWIVNLDKDMVQVPFPDGFRCPDTSFDLFLASLAEQGIAADQVAGVMSETYQGGNASFAPPEYVQKLRRWCDDHDVLLIFDEVQAGFGRTGTYWGFEHYGVTPDLICCGKGISSGMPISAVIGRPDVMDFYPPGAMTSTHTGNPVCAAAVLANLRVIREEGLVERARKIGEILMPELTRIGKRFPTHIGAVHGKGAVASLHIVKPGGIEPDSATASVIVRRCVEKGLLMFSPVGYGGASVKISPPLVTPSDALREGIATLEGAARGGATMNAMSRSAEPLDVLIVGGGMITHDQILPSIYHLQRLGAVGAIKICALNSAPLAQLAGDAGFCQAFPDQTFNPLPGLDEPPERMFPDLYQQAIAAMLPRNLVIVAVPDHFHYTVIRCALEHNQHVLTVKPLVLQYAQSKELEALAQSHGLLVGVEYHKRFDRRALDAQGLYRAGRFGEFRCGEAKMIEPYYYRHSNFQNWFTKENSDPFTYVGCHYVDLVYFITGLRPVEVSVRGVEGPFPNGNVGYLWSAGQVVWENGAILSVLDGLGYPDEAAGMNDQGLCMYCEGSDQGADRPARRSVPRRQPRLRRPAFRRGIPVRQPRLLPARALARRRAQAGRLRLRFDRGDRRGRRRSQCRRSRRPRRARQRRRLSKKSTAVVSSPRRPTATSTNW